MPPKRKASPPLESDSDGPSTKKTKESQPESSGLAEPNEIDCIVRTFGVKALQEYGYIDYLPGKKPVPPKAGFFEPREGYMRDSSAVRKDSEDVFVHPIFRRANWPHVNEDDVWEEMLPALQIASGFLCEPELQPFLEAILRHDRYKAIPGSSQTKFEEYPSNSSDALTTEQIWKEVAELQNCVLFCFVPKKSDAPAFAVCAMDSHRRFKSKPPVHGLVQNKTLPSLINVEAGFFELLMGAHACDDETDERWSKIRKDFDPDARRQRINFLLAVCLFHELAHALHQTTYEFNPNVQVHWLDANKEVKDKVPTIFEPFYRDHRLAELGWALESVVFDGIMDPIDHTFFDNNLSNAVSTAYGIYMSRFPGSVDSTQVPHPENALGTPSQYGVKYGVSYPLPMEYIHRFSTKEFWECTVAKYGLKAYRPQRWHGVRVDNEAPPEGQELDAQSPEPPRDHLTSPPPSIDDFDPTVDPAKPGPSELAGMNPDDPPGELN